jgi:protein required for attachment to host cells
MKGANMRIRVVVADQSEAHFYDAMGYRRPLLEAGALRNPLARLHEREIVADRPGRSLGRAVGGHRGGARHAFGSEVSARKHAVDEFARRLAQELERARRQQRFQRWVLVAGPTMIGRLRAAVTPALGACLAQTIVKDMVHQPATVLRDYLSPETFTGPLGFERRRA